MTCLNYKELVGQYLPVIQRLSGLGAVWGELNKLVKDCLPHEYAHLGLIPTHSHIVWSQIGHWT